MQQIETMRQVKLEESYIITGKSLIAMDVSYFDGQIKLSLNLCRDNIYFSWYCVYLTRYLCINKYYRYYLKALFQSSLLSGSCLPALVAVSCCLSWTPSKRRSNSSKHCQKNVFYQFKHPFQTKKKELTNSIYYKQRFNNFEILSCNCHTIRYKSKQLQVSQSFLNANYYGVWVVSSQQSKDFGRTNYSWLDNKNIFLLYLFKSFKAFTNSFKLAVQILSSGFFGLLEIFLICTVIHSLSLPINYSNASVII